MPPRRAKRKSRHGAKRKSRRGQYSSNSASLPRRRSKRLQRLAVYTGNVTEESGLHFCSKGGGFACAQVELPPVLKEIIGAGELFANTNLHEAVRKQLALKYPKVFVWSNEVTVTFAEKGYRLSVDIHAGRADKSETLSFDQKKLCDEVLVPHKGNKLMVIAIGLQKENGGGHANAVVVNTQNRTLEHFEPHGKTGFLDDNERLTLEKAIQKQIFGCGEFAEYTYLCPEAITPHFWSDMPTSGVQAIFNSASPEKRDDPLAGTCAIWTLWFLNRRLDSPDEEVRTIYRNAMKELYGGKDKHMPLTTIQKNVSEVSKFVEGFIRELFARVGAQTRFKLRDGKEKMCFVATADGDRHLGCVEATRERRRKFEKNAPDPPRPEATGYTVYAPISSCDIKFRIPFSLIAELIMKPITVHNTRDYKPGEDSCGWSVYFDGQKLDAVNQQQSFFDVLKTRTGLAFVVTGDGAISSSWE